MALGPVSLAPVRGDSGPVSVPLPFLAHGYPILYPFQVTGPGFDDRQPRLSPDGHAIVFLSDRAGGTDVFRIEAAGGAPTRLTESPGVPEDTPVWSPDGASVAFAAPTAAGDSALWHLPITGGGDATVALDGVGSDEVHPWFSADGSELYFSSDRAGNWDLYRAAPGSPPAAWTRLTNDPTADRFPVLSPDGAVLVFRSERSGNSEIYALTLANQRLQRITADSAFDSYGSALADGSGYLFDSDRAGGTSAYGVNAAGTGLRAFTLAPGWSGLQASASVDGRWRVSVRRSPLGDGTLWLEPFASPLVQVGQAGADAAGLATVTDPVAATLTCDWTAGVLAHGWARAWVRTRDPRYIAWLSAWVDGCLPTAATTSVNDGLLAYAALVADQAAPRPGRRAYAQAVAEWLLTTARRTPAGALSHTNDGAGVWCDTLISITPFLTELSAVTGDPRYRDEAARQVLLHADVLQDPATGLFHHAWDANAGRFLSAAAWGRGNGWALVGTAAALAALPPDHALRPALLNVFQRQAAALVPLQRPSGLWPAVVTYPDHYEESSGTALIARGLVAGLDAGWLTGAPMVDAVRSARLGLWGRVDATGRVDDVMIETGPNPDDAIYNSLPHHALQLYGQGLMLLATAP